MLSDASEALRKKPGPDLRELAEELEHKRASIIFARAKVFGIAASLAPMFPTDKADPKSPNLAPREKVYPGSFRRVTIKSSPMTPKTFETELKVFSEQVKGYFSVAGRDIYRWPASAAKSFISDIRQHVRKGDFSPDEYDRVRTQLAIHTDDILEALSERWKEMSQTYGSLNRLSRS